MEENLKVKEDCLVLDVVEVEQNHFTEVNFPPAADLPQARHAGLGLLPEGIVPSEAVVGGNVCQVPHAQWPRPDKTHLASHDIDQLWKFVDAQLPDELPHAGHPGVVVDKEKPDPKGSCQQ